MKFKIILFLLLIFSIDSTAQVNSVDKLDSLTNVINNRVQENRDLGNLRTEMEMKLDSSILLSIKEYLNYTKIIFESDRLENSKSNTDIKHNKLYQSLKAIYLESSDRPKKANRIVGDFLLTTTRVFPTSKSTVDKIKINLINKSFYHLNSYCIFENKKGIIIKVLKIEISPFDSFSDKLQTNDLKDAKSLRILNIYFNRHGDKMAEMRVVRSEFVDSEYSQTVQMEIDNSELQGNNQLYSNSISNILEFIKEN